MTGSSFHLGLFHISFNVQQFQGPLHKGMELGQAFQACIPRTLDKGQVKQLLGGDSNHGDPPYALWCTDKREYIYSGEFTWTMVFRKPRGVSSDGWLGALPKVWQGMTKNFVRPDNHLSFKEARLVNPWDGSEQRVACMQDGKMQVEADLQLLLTEAMLLAAARSHGPRRKVTLELTRPVVLDQGQRFTAPNIIAALLRRPHDFFRACVVGYNLPWLQKEIFNGCRVTCNGTKVAVIPRHNGSGHGFLGTVTFERRRQLENILPLLMLTQILGFGKKTAHGYGRCRIK